MRSVISVALLLLVAVTGVWADTGNPVASPPTYSTRSATLELAAGSFNPSKGNTLLGKTAKTRLTSYGDVSNPYKIVQCNGPIDHDWRTALEASGAEILRYIPNNAYLVRIPQGKGAKTWKAPTTNLLWSGDYLPLYKFRNTLLDETGQPELGGDRIRLIVSLFRGVQLSSVIQAITSAVPSLTVQALRYGLPDDHERYDSVIVDVDLNQLDAAVTTISRIPGVEWIDKHVFNYPTNDNAVGIIQSGQATGGGATPLFDNGLTGMGQIICIQDSGLDTDACQFRYDGLPESQTLANFVELPETTITNNTNKVTSYYVMPFADAYDEGIFHGTAVTGCAAGDNYSTLATRGDPGHDSNDGVAPGAQIVFQDIGSRNYSSLIAIDHFNELAAHFQAYNTGARVHNNSWGGHSPFYDTISAEIDHAIWRFNDYTVVFAAGNAGPFSWTLGGNGSTAKNTIVVGATDGTSPSGILEDPDLDGVGAENVTYYSSHGPTWDYRYKPDVVAPGNVFTATEPNGIETGELTGDLFAPEPIILSQTYPPNNNCDTAHIQGTSFASPITAGAAALVRQYFFDGFYPEGRRDGNNAFDPSGALVKAVIINSGKDLTSDGMTGMYSADSGFSGQSIPSYGQGWGRILLDDPLYFNGDNRKLVVLNDVFNGVAADGFEPTATTRLPSITTGETHSFVVENVRSDEPLKITLSWSDPAASPASAIALVNDLDLTVVSPSGEKYQGNVFGQNGFSIPTEEPWDGRNNVENVFINSPEPGNWTVRVVGHNVPGTGAEVPFSSTLQGYALIATGSFATSTEPLVSFLTASLEGGDDDIFLDPGEQATLDVTIQNTGAVDATDVKVTVSLVNETDTDLPSPPLRLDHDTDDEGGTVNIRTEPTKSVTKTVDTVFSGQQKIVKFDVQMQDWPLDYQGRRARFAVSVDFGAASKLSSEFSLPLARDIQTVSYFNFDTGDLSDWILRQDGDGTDPAPAISECDSSTPPGRSGPKALKFGPIDDCDAEYSANDSLVAISPPFHVALGQHLVSLNFFHKFNTEFAFDKCEVYLDRNGDGWFTSTRDRVAQFSGQSTSEMVFSRLPIDQFDDDRTDTLRIAFVFKSNGSINKPLGWIIDDISVTATSVDLGSQSSSLVPLILDVEPDHGTIKGDTLVRITGENFGAAPVVLIGGKPATVVSVEPSETSGRAMDILALTPRTDQTGAVNVEVVNASNGESDIAKNAFTYIEPRNDLATLTVVDRNAVAGATDVAVSILIDSAAAVSEPDTVTFSVTYDPDLATPTRVTAGKSVTDAGKSVLADISTPGVIQITVPATGTSLDKGTLARIVFDIPINVPPDATAVNLACTDATGTNTAGTDMEIECVSGKLILGSISGDLNGDASVNALDVQRIVNLVLAGARPGEFGVPENADDNKDGMLDAVDVQRVVNRTLGFYGMTLAVTSLEAKQGDTIAVPIRMTANTDDARPSSVTFRLMFDKGLLTPNSTRPAVSGESAVTSGIINGSSVADPLFVQPGNLGWVVGDDFIEVTLKAPDGGTIAPGELVRLIFDVALDAPVGSIVNIIPGNASGVNADSIP
ncbi:MAG: S8 family serine peptidase, partial [Candidatus Hydrogenedentes bacterium]|nr:S8 family serine peptidase [Candidatus Hydrogenedentota bacterium]